MVKLGLFDALAQKGLTENELAARIGINEPAATTPLATLEAFDYVKRTCQGRYINTPITAKWLLGTSPSHLADFLAWWHELVFTFWDAFFDPIIRDGEPPLTIYQRRTSAYSRRSPPPQTEWPCRRPRSDERHGVQPDDACCE